MFLLLFTNIRFSNTANTLLQLLSVDEIYTSQFSLLNSCKISVNKIFSPGSSLIKLLIKKYCAINLKFPCRIISQYNLYSEMNHNSTFFIVKLFKSWRAVYDFPSMLYQRHLWYRRKTCHLNK